MDTRIKAIATASMYDMTVAGRGAMNKEMLQRAKDKLSKQRWIDAEHIDLYDKVDRIPFDKLETFFKSNLK